MSLRSHAACIGNYCDAVVEMVNEGQLPDQGFIKQEEISLAPYLATANGSLYQSS